MSGMGSMFNGYPLASLFGQGQMGPIQSAMPPGGGASPFMQGGTPQGGAPFMQGAPPQGQPAQPGIAPGPNGQAGAMSPLAKQMMMMKMMQGAQGGQGPGAASPAGMASAAITPAMNMMLMNKLGMIQ